MTHGKVLINEGVIYHVIKHLPTFKIAILFKSKPPNWQAVSASVSYCQTSARWATPHFCSSTAQGFLDLFNIGT